MTRQCSHVTNGQNRMTRQFSLDVEIKVLRIGRGEVRVGDVDTEGLVDREVDVAPRSRNNVRELIRNRRRRACRRRLVDIRKRIRETWEPTYIRDSAAAQSEWRGACTLKTNFFF